MNTAFNSFNAKLLLSCQGSIKCQSKCIPGKRGSKDRNKQKLKTVLSKLFR